MQHHASVGSLVVGFLVLAMVFGLLERLFAAVPGFSIWRRDRLPDFLYWFFTPLVTRAISGIALAVVIGVLAAAFGFPRDAAHFIAFVRRASPFARQSAALQFVEALFVADFCAYWSHRLFHGKLLWRFHAVHHSAKILDWLAATRLHPVNDAASRLFVSLPILLFGFDLRFFAAIAALLSFYAIFEHANVPWGFGPLKYVVTTPLFHRWHHTSQDEGLDKNFAGMFPVFDIVFGTFYMPEGRQPTVFGVVGDEVPASFVGQLLYPFRSRRRGR